MFQVDEVGVDIVEEIADDVDVAIADEVDVDKVIVEEVDDSYVSVLLFHTCDVVNIGEVDVKLLLMSLTKWMLSC